MMPFPPPPPLPLLKRSWESKPDIDSLLEGIVEDTGETSQQLASAVSINDLFG